MSPGVAETHTLEPRRAAALLVAGIGLFVALNAFAYRGYFMHDDFEFLSWAPKLRVVEFLKAFFEPLYLRNNFRPVGHFYYHVMGNLFGLQFPPYIASIHLLHVLNTWLVWRILRKFGFGTLAAVAGVIFFAFHVSLFDAWRKPSYVFEILAATFCLLALTTWQDGRWLLSLACFWTAYKSKELAVMFPAVLVFYEVFLGQRAWKRILPFLALSLSFGLQALLFSPHTSSVYTFHFNLAALRQTVPFYSKRLLWLPHSGLALIVLPAFVRDRRLWFGAAYAILFFFPLFFLPGRLEAVYWYLPMSGVAIAIAALAEAQPRALALFLLLWIPWDLINFSRVQRKLRTIEQDNRVYVAALANYSRSHPEVNSFIYAGAPPGLPDWGIRAAIDCVYDRQYTKLYFISDPAARAAVQNGSVALLSWDQAAHRLDIIDSSKLADRASYLDLQHLMVSFHLGYGWHDAEINHRWTEPDAAAELWRPENAHDFELIVNVPPAQIQSLKAVTLRVFVGNQTLEGRELTQPGQQALRWKLPSAPAGPARIEFHATPPFRPSGDPRVFGVAVLAFGFPPG